jgi:uncharacterized protein YebE (UPF0316 family)
MTVFSHSLILSVLLIFFLRVIDVSLGTIRMIITLHGRRIWATVIGFVEITIWVVAVSQVITNLDSVWKVLAYSGGFAAGTIIGMWLEERLALGDVAVYVISPEKGTEITRKIRKANYGATELPAYGRSGPVSMLGVVTSRKRLEAFLKLVDEIDENAFVTVEYKRKVYWGFGRSPNEVLLG